MRYIILRRLPALPADFLSCCYSHQRPPFSEIQEVAGKDRLHTIDDAIVLLVRQPTPHLSSDSQHPVGRTAFLLNDEPVRIYVPLLMRPLVMQGRHSRQLPATSEPRALRECSNVFAGGLV